MKSRIRLLSILYATSLIAGASLLAFGNQSAAPAQAGNNGRPSVILISIDTLRADHLGVYGYPGNPTPHIDSFAEHGTVFTQVDSQIPLTLPSHTCLFTSTYPFQNHIEENAEIVPANVTTLASVLRSNGYQTGAFIGSVLLSRRYGLDKGFNTYESPFHAQAGQNIDPYSVRVRRDGALVTRSALSWLAAQHGQPVFEFVHLFDMHTPYAVRQFSGARLLPNRAGYDAELRYVDQIIGSFKDALTRGGWWQRSVVILLSDHGESLGDHGETSHGYFAYESTLHVPLIIHWPASEKNSPQHVNEPAGLIDVAPTLLGYLHIPAPPSFAGVNLLNSPSNAPRRVYSETNYAHDAFHWSVLRRIRIGELAYIDAPRPELYDLRADPGEHENIANAHAAEARKLQDQLTSVLVRYSRTTPAAAQDRSPESVAALRSLGYLAGGATVPGGPSGPDPKDRLPEYQQYEKALTDLYTNQSNSAVAQFRALLAKDPANTLARYYLGETYVKMGRAADALREWQTAIDRDHTYEPALVAMGDLYLLQRTPAKARTVFAQATLLVPSDYEAQFQLGIAEEQLGLQQDARRHIEQACKIANDDADACRHALDSFKERH